MSAALRKIEESNRRKRAERDRAIAVTYLHGARAGRIGATCIRLAAYYGITRERVRRTYYDYGDE